VVVDLVIRHATVVTMNASRQVLRDAEVVVQGNRIVRVGPSGHAPPRACRVLDARGKVVIPGLIHGHLHACQTLFRNQADGLELLDWLRERVWPFEAAHDPESLRASADLTFLECLKSGATSVLDMGTVRHYGSVFESARDAGIRLVGGKCMMDAGQGVPHGLRETTADSIAQSLALIDAWHGAEDGRLRYALAPRFVLSCSESLLRQVQAIAQARGVRIHTHASENPTECDVVREKTGYDNVAYFNHLAMLGPHLTLAHCVWLTAEEQRLLHTTNTRVTHCPSANLKLASGIAKVPELLGRGVSIALGADGAACNNNLDIWVEMRLAALLHKPRAGPTSMSALQVLEMATLHGARALGLESEIGAIVEGYRADLTVVDLAGAHLTPASDDVVSTLVYSGQSRDVTDVVVDGQLVVADRQVKTLDEAQVLARARTQAARLLAVLD
jgi:5-methylthioadenosine/S-adenosylhomocysteine deaminase